MRVTMDKVGRVVVPKAIREQLGLGPDAELDMVVDGSAVRLQPIATPVRKICMVDGWPVLSAVRGHVLTDADVRDLRDADRR